MTIRYCVQANARGESDTVAKPHAHPASSPRGVGGHGEPNTSMYEGSQNEAECDSEDEVLDAEKYSKWRDLVTGLHVDLHDDLNSSRF